MTMLIIHIVAISVVCVTVYMAGFADGRTDERLFGGKHTKK